MNSNQRGGIVSFVVVSLALVGLLAGGLYLSKSQARTARDTAGAPQVATQQADDTKKQAETPPKTDDAKKEPAKPESPKPQDTQNTNRDAPATLPGNRVANTGPSGDIPATGPADTALYALGFGSLTFTGYHLIRSRRLVRQNALKR